MLVLEPPTFSKQVHQLTPQTQTESPTIDFHTSADLLITCAVASVDCCNFNVALSVQWQQHFSSIMIHL
jgi:hypothetical protein